MRKYERIVLYIVIFLSGVILKLYDDMNDNSLFEKNEYLYKNKNYINEFLKGSHALLFSYSAIKDFYFFICFFIINYVQYIFKPETFMEYEYSGLLSLVFFGVIVIYEHYDFIKDNIISNFNNLFLYIGVILSFIVYQYIFDIYIVNNIEYGYKKLFVRIQTILIGILLFIVLNNEKIFNYFNILDIDINSNLNNSISNFIIWMLGYTTTSSIFQIYLIKTNKN
jgi:hypothetical protein